MIRRFIQPGGGAVGNDYPIVSNVLNKFKLLEGEKTTYDTVIIDILIFFFSIIIVKCFIFLNTYPNHLKHFKIN